MHVTSDVHNIQLSIDRCPRCNIASPLLIGRRSSEMQIGDGWVANLTQCTSCSRTVMVEHRGNSVREIFPNTDFVFQSIPDRARKYLEEAMSSAFNAPSGAVMLTASSVDWMLKEKGYKDGSLYSRIKKAADEHLITAEMMAWAHEIRIDANDQRHADETATLPTTADAEKAISFARALGEFLFELPSRVERGRVA